jgi:hypothetical protein
MIDSLESHPIGEARARFRKVLRCARAISLAYLDSAGREGKLEAQRGFLANRLLELEVSRDEWLDFIELWPAQGPSSDATSDRPCIVQAANGDVLTYVCRKKGHYCNGRLSVFRCAEMLLGTSVPRTVLADWYRSELRDHYHFVDSAEFISFVNGWLARVRRLEYGDVPIDELLDAAQPAWSRGLVEALEFLRILDSSETAYGCYRRLADFSDSAVISEILGSSTGFAGLDYLLQGAMRVPPERQTILVTGAAGMGKSTMALGLAAQTAARGGLALYFRFEVEEQLTLRQLYRFYRHLLPYFHLDTQQSDPSAPAGKVPED